MNANRGIVGLSRGARRLRATLEGLAEHEELDLVVDGQDTSAGNTTEDVGTSTLEEGLGALLGDDLGSSVEGRLVLDGLWNFVSISLSEKPAIVAMVLTSPEVIIIRRRMVSSG